MNKRSHTTVSGYRIEYEETPNVVAFFHRLEAASADPNTSERDLTGLAFSSENPLLDQTLFPGQGAVTRHVLQEPAYHVMVDLLFRKLLADETDITKLAARYSMTIAEASSKLGVCVNAIRQAIAARWLAEWVKNGKHFIDPGALDSVARDR